MSGYLPDVYLYRFDYRSPSSLLPADWGASIASDHIHVRQCYIVYRAKILLFNVSRCATYSRVTFRFQYCPKRFLSNKQGVHN